MKPRALKPGDTVGLITPGTWVADPDRVALARHTMEFLGLKCKFGRTVGRRESSLAAAVKDRLDDLHAMFEDPDVQAVMCVRGGYGASRLLDSVDYGLIRRRPKIFMGYSDITALHLAIHQSTGMVTFHGPIVLSSFTDYTLEHFKRAIFDPRPLGRLANPPEQRAIRPRHPIRTLRAGTARGPLTGGNLSLICATMGTPWEIQTSGRILFLEDTDEQPYSMDRMLTHLRLAGKFKDIRGLVLGECANCVPREFQPSLDSPYSLGEVLDGILGDLKVPIVSGLTIGHTGDQLTLPLGVTATLDAGDGSLTIEESALSE
ncbi:MAG: LD-carboxypeptidase [Candidatus Solibacter usitatus]|nr:LD-carboxypeptidase [Candidatus Solibacter usitatus]